MTVLSRPLAVVTGASSGIGEQFARRYAREGYDLVLVARSAAALRAVADDLMAKHGVSVDVHVADLTVSTDVAGLITALDARPRLDHLVNNAAVAPEGDLVDADEGELRRLIDLNVTALTVLTRAAVVRMRAAGRGTIINIASGAAYQPLAHLAAYAASKAYVLMFTEALFEENRTHGLRIFAVSPGDTDTPMNTSTTKAKRRPEQVVETAFRNLTSSRPSVVDGAANSAVATAAVRVLPKRVALRIGERLMREKA